MNEFIKLQLKMIKVIKNIKMPILHIDIGIAIANTNI